MVVTYSVEVLNSSARETVCDFFAHYHSSDRMSISHRFSNCDNIRNNSLQLEGPVVFTNTTEASLDLVSNTDTTGISHMLINTLQIPRRQENLPAAAEHALCDEGAHVAGILPAHVANLVHVPSRWVVHFTSAENPTIHVRN